jgi:two-component system sensor histidine kinase CpxA
VADVNEELQHMSSLVNELLQFSRSTAATQQVTLRPIEISELLQRVVNREGMAESTIKLQVPHGLEVNADPECLFRAAANVVRNAIRYAGDAGPIEVSATRERDKVQIRVADSGPGIPEPELDNVFRPFYRPEFARSRETGGAGLGLAIVRDCIESCGGKVECRNRKPKGLEVIMVLPAALPVSV